MSTTPLPGIPQGSKLIGTYDANVRFGQERVFLVWTRIVFPDASALDLTEAQGIDAAGYAGFEDQVNNHYVRTFGSAILLSAIGAGAQLSQPAPVAGETISPLQIGAAELGRTLAETGRETLRRNLDVAPTLTIRPGYRFNVFVQRDIRFDRPWR